MNILMVSRFSILDRRAGTFRYIHDLSCELARRGHQVYWICKKEHAVGGRYVDQMAPGYWIYRIGIKKSFSVWNTWQMMSQLNNLAEELDQAVGIDLVCLHSLSAGPLLSQSNLCKRVPFVGLYYAPVFFEYAFNQRSLIQDLPSQTRAFHQIKTLLYSRLQFFVERFMLNQVDQIVTLSQYSIDQLIEHYDIVLADKAIVIPAGVDVNRFKPAEEKAIVRKRLDFPPNATVFFTLRNLMPRMGLEQLIEAVSNLKDMVTSNRFLLYIGGRGPLHKRLKSQISDAGLDDLIKMVGFIPDEEVPFYYQAADFFILPTEALEGFGVVTIEALASNIPVVATPVGATPEILQKAGGFLTKSAEPEDIAETMRFVIDNREQIFNQWDSRFVIDTEYSWQVIGDRIENLFLELQQRFTTDLLKRVDDIHESR